MTTPELKPLLLELSGRDVQAVACMIEMCAVLLAPSAPEEAVQHNYDQMEALFDGHYTDAEWDALRKRNQALLPIDSPLYFTAPRFIIASGTTVIQ